MNLSEKLPRLLGQLGSSGSAQISDAGELMPDADVSHISRKWLDVPYATTSPAQRLDIYLPERGEGPFPVILFIHGGAFMMGDKRDFQISSFLGGLERGYAVVGINYRLSGEAVFPAGLQDVKAAVRWLRARRHIPLGSRPDRRLRRVFGGELRSHDRCHGGRSALR